MMDDGSRKKCKENKLTRREEKDNENTKDD